MCKWITFDKKLSFHFEWSLSKTSSAPETGKIASAILAYRSTSLAFPGGRHQLHDECGGLCLTLVSDWQPGHWNVICKHVSQNDAYTPYLVITISGDEPHPVWHKYIRLYEYSNIITRIFNIRIWILCFFRTNILNIRIRSLDFMNVYSVHIRNGFGWYSADIRYIFEY